MKHVRERNIIMDSGRKGKPMSERTKVGTYSVDRKFRWLGRFNWVPVAEFNERYTHYKVGSELDRCILRVAEFLADQAGFDYHSLRSIDRSKFRQSAHKVLHVKTKEVK